MLQGLNGRSKKFSVFLAFDISSLEMDEVIIYFIFRCVFLDMYPLGYQSTLELQL